MRRVATACLVGSAIEFYDFLIYGTAAALVFPTVFFPHLEPAVATFASMGTFGAAFLSRPVGAAVFGYFGDHLGRRKALVAALLIMAVSTVTVGLVPSTAAIGAAAPLILVALRLLQGFAVGGYWAGSALLSAEYAPADKRGRYGMFTHLGGGTALVVSSLTFLTVNFTIGEGSAAFMQWGWRLPFLISAGLIVVALYVWFKIGETPLFAEEKARNLVPKAPLTEVLHLQGREIALAGGSVLVSFGFVFMAGTYLTTYAHSHLGYSRNLILFVGVLGGLASIASVALSATLCDRVGRRRMMLVGWAGCLLWSFAVIPLVNTGNPVLYALAIVVMYAVWRDRQRADCGLYPRVVLHPLPLHGVGAVGQPRRRRRWRPAAADRRNVAGDLRQLGDRSHAGLSRGGQPGVHLPTSRNQWNGAAHYARCARRSPAGRAGAALAQLACRSSLSVMP